VSSRPIIGAWRGQRGIGAIAIVLALLSAAILYFGYFRMQTAMSEKKTTLPAIDASRAVACLSNRQNVERDIQMWLVNHPGETPSFAALEADGLRIPHCPEGGEYSLVGVQVHCSKHE
jgi:hypothetical protein